MTTIKINCDELHLELDVTPSQTIINCIVKALVAAMPVALDAFFKCITSNGGSEGYKPGDRDRCPD